MPMNLIVGIVLGFLAGLGVGGGSLLILWLTLVLNMTPETARCVNLMFFIPSAITAAIFRWKQGSIDLKKLLPAILAGCASALLFSLLGRNLNTQFLQKLFGGLLIAAGIRELLYKQNREGQ